MVPPDLPTSYWRAANTMCWHWRQYGYGHGPFPPGLLPMRHREGVTVTAASLRSPWFVSQRKRASKIHAARWAVMLWGRAAGPVLLVRGFCGQMISYPGLLDGWEDAPSGFGLCETCALASGAATITVHQVGLDVVAVGE